jgi:uncharacterized protein
MTAARLLAMTGVLLAAGAASCGPDGSEEVVDQAVAGLAGDSTDCGPDPIAAWAASGRGESRDAAAERVEERWLDYKRCLAEAGDAEAQVVMGVAYRDGSDGPPQDFARAAAWFARAAEQGHPMAQFNMGSLYEDGRGVPEDLVLAHMWFNLAAAAFPWPGDMRSRAFLRRDRVAERLTAAQLRDAQQRATGWWEQRAASAGTDS